MKVESSFAAVTKSSFVPVVANADEAVSLRQAFIRSMRHVPGAVAIVATACGGQRRGLTVTAWCSLSAKPPSILVCVNKNANAHDFILKSGKFSVNQLGVGHTEMVAVFSNQRGLEDDARFNADGWEMGASGVPVLPSAIVSIECRLTAHHGHVTHTIFIGEVDRLRIAPQGEPLVYLNSSCARAAGVKQQDAR